MFCFFVFPFSKFPPFFSLPFKIESKLGTGLSTIFDEAVQHIAESLGTNFWISFIRTEAFTNIDRRPKIIGAFDLKKVFLIPSFLSYGWYLCYLHRR